MPDKNFTDAVLGHISDLEKKESGGTDDDVKKLDIHNRSGLDDNIEVRDLLTGLVGKWNDLKSDDRSPYIVKLGQLIGKPTAQKLINSIFIFNDRDDVKGKNAEQRVGQFYDLGNEDKDVNNVIARSRSLGYGVQEGLRTSPDILNEEATKRFIPKKDTAHTIASDKIKDIASGVISK